MAISSSDIKFYYSGGSANTSASLSLGGSISNTEITSSTLNNLFDDVSGDESAAGDVEYRCLFVKNTHSTLTWQTVKTWIESNTAGLDSVDIGLDAASGTPAATIADESTAPSGVTFSAPTSKSGGLSIGNVSPGGCKAIWIRRTVPAGCGAYNNNAFIIKVEGDTAA